MDLKQPAEQTPELAAAIARARRPVEPLRSPSTGLIDRLKSVQAEASRRLLPTRVAVARAERRGRTIWKQDQEVRERARATITAIVAGTARAGEAEKLAMEHVIEDQVREAFFWRHWKTPGIDPASKQRLLEAFTADRAVLLSSCHLGPFFYGAEIVHSLGHTQYSVAAPWLFQTPPPGPWGMRLSRWSEAISARNERLIYSVGSFEVIEALLEQREIVKLYYDMPGGQPTQFLGKPVMLSGGSARLALQTDALVLPTRVRRVGHRVWMDVAQPLDARDFTSLEELHTALATAHERWILELPATLEDPNRDGAWERGATARAWTRPEPPVRQTHNRLLAS
jgi:lauroyl/myristoyl acyltransferase